MANDIKERVRKGEGVDLKKNKRGKEPEIMKISSHLPLILDNLRNEALRERRSMKEESEGARHIIMNESLKWPWISLIVKEDDKSTPIPFRVMDARLIDPARTLALQHLNGIREFTPLHLLSGEEKKKAEKGGMTLAHNPRRQSPPEIMEDS